MAWRGKAGLRGRRRAGAAEESEWQVWRERRRTDWPRIARRLLQEVVNGRRVAPVHLYFVKEQHGSPATLDVLAHVADALCAVKQSETRCVSGRSGVTRVTNCSCEHPTWSLPKKLVAREPQDTDVVLTVRRQLHLHLGVYVATKCAQLRHDTSLDRDPAGEDAPSANPRSFCQPPSTSWRCL